MVVLKLVYSLLMAAMLLSPASNTKLYLITNAANPDSPVDNAQIKQIFLGQKTRWQDGSKIQLVDNLNKKAAKKFYKETTGRELSRIKKDWIAKMLQGKMNPPESFRDEDELIEYIARNKHAIGFVTNPQSHKKIKILQSFDLE